MAAKIITVAQQKGGTGKSTVAIHLAVAYAKKGLSVMLFDTDPQGTAGTWRARRKGNDVSLLATSGWRLSRDLAMAKDMNDVIIIDSPPHAEMDIKVSTRAADLVVVPIQPSPADLWAVHETMKTIQGENRNCMAVLNRVVPRAKITQEIVTKLKLLDVPLASTIIGSRTRFASSLEEGLTVLDDSLSKSSTEVNALALEVAEKVGLKWGSAKTERTKGTLGIATKEQKIKRVA